MSIEKNIKTNHVRFKENSPDKRDNTDSLNNYSDSEDIKSSVDDEILSHIEELNKNAPPFEKPPRFSRRNPFKKEFASSKYARKNLVHFTYMSDKLSSKQLSHNESTRVVTSTDFSKILQPPKLFEYKNLKKLEKDKLINELILEEVEKDKDLISDEKELIVRVKQSYKMKKSLNVLPKSNKIYQEKEALKKRIENFVMQSLDLLQSNSNLDYLIGEFKNITMRLNRMNKINESTQTDFVENSNKSGIEQIKKTTNIAVQTDFVDYCNNDLEVTSTLKTETKSQNREHPTKKEETSCVENIIDPLKEEFEEIYRKYPHLNKNDFLTPLDLYLIDKEKEDERQGIYNLNLSEKLSSLNLNGTSNVADNSQVVNATNPSLNTCSEKTLTNDSQINSLNAFNKKISEMSSKSSQLTNQIYFVDSLEKTLIDNSIKNCLNDRRNQQTNDSSIQQLNQLPKSCLTNVCLPSNNLSINQQNIYNHLQPLTKITNNSADCFTTNELLNLSSNNYPLIQEQFALCQDSQFLNQQMFQHHVMFNNEHARQMNWQTIPPKDEICTMNNFPTSYPILHNVPNYVQQNKVVRPPPGFEPRQF